MSEGSSHSIISLGELSKPADTLIKKVSQAVGGLFAPHQIVRIAKADAKAAIIKTQANIEITDLQRRAMHRFLNEEAQHQKSMEDITTMAVPQLLDRSDPALMDNDWITNFFDKSRIVSDEEMQRLWSRILAGEANAPGSFSKRTVNFLSDLDKRDSELFEKLCAFGWVANEMVPLVFDADDEIYVNHGVSFSTLIHLESIGFIKFGTLTGFRWYELPKRLDVSYKGKVLQLEMEKETGNALPIGKVLFSRVGQELASICASPEVEGFFDYVKTKWAPFLLKDQPAEAANALQ